MIKTLAVLLVLLIPSLSQAKDQVVVLKKNCYRVKSVGNSSLLCKGEVMNIGATDLKKVTIQSAFEGVAKYDQIDYLPSKKKSDFTFQWTFRDYIGYDETTSSPKWTAVRDKIYLFNPDELMITISSEEVD